jgi:hypothetical protein
MRQLAGSGCRSLHYDLDQRLVAYYPDDMPGLDHPFVPVLDDRARDAGARRKALDAFGAWLRGPAGQGSLAAAGLRPVNGAPPPDSPASQQDGNVMRDLAAPAAGPTAATVRRDLGAYTAAHQPGRVVFLLDGSLSMGRGNVIDAATAAVGRTLDLMGRGDAVGVLQAPSSDDNDGQPADLYPPGDIGAPVNRADVESALDRARVFDSGVAMYDAIDAALKDMHVGNVPERQVLVVITEGDDPKSGRGQGPRSRVTPDGLNRLGERFGRIPIFIVALPPTGCYDDGLGRIAADSGGRCVTDLGDTQALSAAVAGAWGGGSGA